MRDIFFHDFCRLLIFPKVTFSQNIFGNTIRVHVSNRFDPDQDGRFVGPDLGQTVFKLGKVAAGKQRVSK